MRKGLGKETILKRAEGQLKRGESRNTRRR